MTDQSLALIDGPVEPGLVPRGFAEHVLARASEMNDPVELWEGALTLSGLAQKWNGHAEEKREIKTAQMYCEIELGQMLGPRPGPQEQDEHGHFLPAPFSNSKTVYGLIPPPRVTELQSLHGWRDALIEEVRKRRGKLSHHALLVLVSQWEMAKNAPADGDEPDIRAGDVTDLSSIDVEPASVDAIVTDPPYPKEFLGVYEHLSALGARVLKPGGSLLAMVGQSYLPVVMNGLARHLDYHWTIAYLTPGGQAVQLWDRSVNTFWKPILWFTKGEYEGFWHGDVVRSAVNDNDKRFHEWGQSESGMAAIIDRYTTAGQLILDPFVGGGTTGVIALRMGRRFIGIDSSAAARKTARERILANRGQM